MVSDALQVFLCFWGEVREIQVGWHNPTYDSRSKIDILLYASIEVVSLGNVIKLRSPQYPVGVVGVRPNKWFQCCAPNNAIRDVPPSLDC